MRQRIARLEGRLGPFANFYRLGHGKEILRAMVEKVKAPSEETQLVVMHCDLYDKNSPIGRFKHLNEEFGRENVDVFLGTLAKRIQEWAQDSSSGFIQSVVFHLEGVKFVVAFLTKSETDAAEYAGKLQTTIQKLKYYLPVGSQGMIDLEVYLAKPGDNVYDGEDILSVGVAIGLTTLRDSSAEGPEAVLDAAERSCNELKSNLFKRAKAILEKGRIL
ncbi:MAG: GGDEF domain-containing protein [Candidatus Margulisbacteria bacterium]|nr:GGDEF domain-containing protein [Candidatus Margulisiibacteriota bacterium]